MRGVWKRLSKFGLRTALACAVLAVMNSTAFAQSAPPATVTPSTKIGVAPLIDPALMATSGYGTGAQTIDPLVGARPHEVVELARALSQGLTPDQTVDRVFDFVHNNIEIAWTFGLQKGALGAIIDHSGTDFDQAKLMVDVLTQVGISARVQFGTITLTGAQFQAWSGLTNATAACQLLANGGIPASINGSVHSDCSYNNVPLSTITLAHAWVAVTLGANTYVFDPAYKAHTFKVQDSSLASQITAGQALSQAGNGMASGSVSGAAYVQTLNGALLTSSLQAYAGNVQNLIQNNHAAGEIEGVVGGAHIAKTYPASIRVTSFTSPGQTYSSQLFANWTNGIPDDYRTSLTVQVMREIGDRSYPQILSYRFFVDDIYGRKLTVIARDQPQLGGLGQDVLRVVDEFGGYTTVVSYSSTDTPGFNDAYVTLSVNHPYPDASSGTAAPGPYMDETVTKHVTMWMPLLIVDGFGDVGRDFVAKWGSRDDTDVVPDDPATCDDSDGHAIDSCSPYAQGAGDGRREQLAAAWLTQSSRAAHIHAAIAGAHYTHHHSIGVVAADTQMRTTRLDPALGASSPMDYDPTYSFDRVDIDTAFSLASDTGDATARRAAVHAIAETLEVLEGSVAGQIADLPDISSVATRFDWGNAPPPAEDNPFNTAAAVGPRKFYLFAAGAAPPDLTKVEGQTTPTGAESHPDAEPVIGAIEGGAWKVALQTALTNYTAAGFTVVAAEESFLGPGQRGGTYSSGPPTVFTHQPTEQRGGALVATRYVNGDPVEIAHATVNQLGSAKGGGGGAQPNHQAQYDPSKAADVLKARFVDRSSAEGVDLLAGGVTYKSPAELEVGSGEFPDKLSAEVFWRGGETKGYLQPPGMVEPQTPWSTNWNNTLTMSGSGMEAMGLTDVRASAGTIAAFLAMQDVYKASPSAQREATAELIGSWWAKQMVHNVVTANVGAGTEQFLRRADGTWFAPGPASYATLQQNGPPIPPYTQHCGGQNYVYTRGWDYSSTSFTVTHAHGDTQAFVYWQNRVRDGGFCSDMHGFRLSSWTFPKGVIVNLTYTPVVDSFDILTGVSNTLGRRLTFGYSAGQLSSITDGTRTISIANDPSGSAVHTDANGKVTSIVATRLGGWNTLNGPAGARYELQQVIAADDTNHAALSYTYDSMFRIAQASDRLAVLSQRNPHTFLIGFGMRGERVDPTGARYAVDYDDNKHPIRFSDELGRITSAIYDGRGRVSSYTYPELDQEVIGYDDRNNQTLLQKIAKPSTAESSQTLAIGATYDPTWNKIATLTDARGALTIFNYVSGPGPGNGAGELANAIRPGGATYSFTYNAFGQPATATDPTNVVTAFGYDGFHYPNSTTLDPGGVNAVTTSTNDPVGNQIAVDGPRRDVNDVSFATYDGMRRKLLQIQPDPGTGRSTATRNAYDPVGRVIVSDQGYAVGTTSFTPLITTTTTYDSVGNKASETTPAGVTQFSYDPMNRVVCTAKRNNPALTPPADACIASQPGAFGTDQITQNTYDAAGQLRLVQIGIGTSEAQTFEALTYSPNGQKTTVADGVSNQTTLVYDGFDRLKSQLFPLPSRGVLGSDPSDHEDYGYDLNANQTQLTKRDGTVILSQYDPLNQLTQKTVPSDASHLQDILYAYDPAGRMLSAQYAPATTPGSAFKGVQYGYDTAGRQITETSYNWTVTSVLDQAGNRSQLIWPDGFSVQYAYDAANRMTTIREPGAISGAGVLATLSYDDLGRRTGLARGNGGSASYSFDGAGRLNALTQAAGPTSIPSVQTMTYSPVDQIVTLTQASTNYVWRGQPTTTLNFTYNGLNQDAAIAVLPLGFDHNGNFTNNGSRNYTYDAKNRMTFAGDGVTAMGVAYDPLGRIRATHSSSNVWSFFLYAGDQVIGEYADKPANQPPLDRYVHADGVDDPVAWYVGADTSQRRWFHADRQGSIIAWSDVNNVIQATYTYGPYGEPSDWTGPRFRYTGQVVLPEVQAYFYKARLYDPVMGRFLQTDPIGQKDDPDLYAYVKDDPVNHSDPTGNDACPGTAPGTCIRSDTFDPAKSIGQNVRNTPEMDKSMVENKNLVKSTGSVEKAVEMDKNGKIIVPAGQKASGNVGADSVGMSKAPDAAGVLHGHISGTSDGLVDQKGLGDAQPLTKGLTNGTAIDGRVGVREIVDGRVQFRMLDGRMDSSRGHLGESSETQRMQNNLNIQQKIIDQVLSGSK